MGEVSKQAEQVRWKWKSDKARTAARSAFENHDRHLAGDWCDHGECLSLTQEAKRLGGSPDRYIQRWPTKGRFMDVMQSCVQQISEFGHVFVSIMDEPDSEWIRMSESLVLTELVPAASEWMTDGFVVFESETSSILSVDVEEKNGQSTIETTLIGTGLADLRKCLSEHGPVPQTLVDQDRPENQRPRQH